MLESRLQEIAIAAYLVKAKQFLAIFDGILMAIMVVAEQIYWKYGIKPTHSRSENRITPQEEDSVIVPLKSSVRYIFSNLPFRTNWQSNFFAVKMFHIVEISKGIIQNRSKWLILSVKNLLNFM